MSAVRVLNGRFDPMTQAEVLDWATDWIRSGRSGYLCTVNVAILMMMRADPRLQRFVDGAAMTVADGAPIVWASRLLARPLPERVAGVDLIEALAARAEREGFGVYLMGARPDVVTAAAARLRRTCPGLNICGVADGYFAAAEAAERARTIRRSGAQILFVGMGVPRQDFFLETHWADLGVNLAIGVGGSFEILAETRRRAPRAVQVAGLEWLYRLVQEPRRLWKRYLVTNSQFLYHLSRDLAPSRTARGTRSEARGMPSRPELGRPEGAGPRAGR